MDITLGFLLYATLFRLAIIAVGAVSIFLGYRLFVKDPIGQGRASAIAEAGDFKLTLKNFWPGAFFAAFGTVIIGIMLWQGNPELIMRELKGAKSAAGEGGTVEIRGSDNGADIDRYWQALSDPTIPLAQAARPISRIAAVWQKEQRIGEALAMARLAVRIDSANPDYLALFAWLLLESGDQDKALQAMEAAAGLDTSYQEELSKLQERLKK